eukprot:TRINITY_DN398_c0_g3_i1.p3 TRINITY_DN398_c0_g3~~TRINITY_DN398_c0_g3_i1.p3  ORF type:complete len:119 (-),score=12.40 TRINITY_DN398_c0_g3_i1:274-630(-)
MGMQASMLKGMVLLGRSPPSSLERSEASTTRTRASPRGRGLVARPVEAGAAAFPDAAHLVDALQPQVSGEVLVLVALNAHTPSSAAASAVATASHTMGSTGGATAAASRSSCTWCRVD